MGDKGKETRRFDKFVVIGRFTFINQETGRYKQNWETPDVAGRLGRSDTVSWPFFDKN